MSAKSITHKRKGKSDRPEKPYPDFPLFAHASGRWAKKINGAFCYYGSWQDDPDGKRAAALWEVYREPDYAGRPRPQVSIQVSGSGVAAEITGQSATVKLACDAFLTAKEQRLESGELAQRSFDDLKATCIKIADTFGRQRAVEHLTPDDFRNYRASIAKKWGAWAIHGEIGRVRTLFKWTFESGLIEKPVRFGPDFARPSRKTMRLARAAAGPRMFEAADLRKIIDAAGVQVKAMILLGVNCGLGNADCSRLTFDHIKAAWLDFSRPKTGVARRSPLWPETIKALEAAFAKRPEPHDKANENLVFITKYGRPWSSDKSRNSPLSHEFAKLVDNAGLTRNGRNFYALRHVLETIGGAAKDQPALDMIMGHDRGDMAATYREGIDDARLKAVSGHVRAWLFGAVVKKRKPR